MIASSSGTLLFIGFPPALSKEGHQHTHTHTHTHTTIQVGASANIKVGGVYRLIQFILADKRDNYMAFITI